MRRYSLLVVILMLSTTACKKEIGKTNEPSNTNQLADIGVNPPICAGNNWVNVSTYPTRQLAVTYNDKLYVPDPNNGKIKIFDGNSWTSITSNIPQALTSGSPFSNHFDWATFTIGNKGYFLETQDPGAGLWEYNFTQNTWKRKFDFPGSARFDPACFSIGDKGYMVGGWFDLDTYISQAWEYDQTQDRWFQIPSIGRRIAAATGFSINNKGYIIGGRVLNGGNEDYANELLEYDPSTAHWSTRADFPGQARQNASVFVIGNKVYAGGGGTNFFSDSFDDFYRYTPGTNSWIRVADLPGIFQMDTFFGFSINSLGYCVTDFEGNNSIYKYIPQVCTL